MNAESKDIIDSTCVRATFAFPVMHSGRPSSATAQHVINMIGMDPGLGLSSGGIQSVGGNGTVGTSTATTANGSGTSMSSHPSALPGSFRSTPSQQQYQQQNLSPRASGNLSPQTIGSPTGNLMSNYASPQSVQGALSPPLIPSTSQLGRSQSLGHAAYQQYQNNLQQKQQQQQHQQQLPQSSTTANMYALQGAGSSTRRDRSQQYSDGGIGTQAAVNAGTLPTINTQIPSSSLMNSPYSPSNRHQITFDPSTSARVSTGSSSATGNTQPHSPTTTAATSYGSPYIPSQHLPQQQSAGTRPMSMIDPNTGYGHNLTASYGGAQTISPVAGSSKRASFPHTQNTMDQTSVLPLHNSPQINSPSGYGDSLPLYSTGSSSRLPISSPYMPMSPNNANRVGAPPRTTTISGAYSPVHTPSDRMSIEPNAQATPRKERRNTVTSHDNVTRQQLGQFEEWERKQRMLQKRQDGFRRVRDLNDLKVNLEPAQQGIGRRADPMGGYVSPLKAMTAYLHHTYHLVNPAFFYELSFNPRRVLTKPSRPMHNDGHDNEDSDYILYVNDWLGTEEGNRYLILDILGQGTFGQVVKCQNMKTREIVAVKVIKNKPAYFNQSMMEVTILEMLNGNWDPNDEHHILRLRDTFIHAKHLCLVFELLSSNLYELIKQNSFRGLSTSLVRVFTTQLLDALTVLNEARLIHCDLKPENILLKTLQTPSIKLVDFGSACHERQTVYTYIQSRFYRSPEVLLGLPYNSAIDMWSLGCIAIELFLGLPLFPGTSEYNQICRIVEMLGLPPRWMLEQGKQTGEFFNVYSDEYGRKQYKLKSIDQYSKEHKVQEQPSKRYFQATTLPDIVKTYPMSKKSGKAADVQKEMANRASFIDFTSGLLNMDPNLRWTPQQSKLHPFITGEKYVQPFKPPVTSPASIQRSTRPGGSAGQSNISDPNRHPFGGLPEAPTRSTGRTYQDAAAYSQHLAQQQAHNAAHQARQNQINNPYVREDVARAEADAQAGSHQAQLAATQAHAQAQAQAQAQIQAQAHAQAQAAQLHGTAMSPQYGQSQVQGGHGSTSAYTQNRSRSNTLTRMEIIPPQMAKMGLESSHRMTPVMNRDESMREWERQQQAGASNQAGSSGMASTSQGKSSGRSGKQRNDYHNLDLLHQQAEQQAQMSVPYNGQHQQQQVPYQSPNSNAQNWQAAANSLVGMANSQQVPVGGTSYVPSSSMSPSGMKSRQQSFSVVVDGQQQQQRLPASASANFAGSSPTMQGGTVPTQIAAPPPAAYASSSRQPSSAPNTNGAVAGLSFDPYQSDISQLQPALHPTQYHTVGHAPINTGNPQTRHSMGSGNTMPSSNRHSIAIPHISSPNSVLTNSGGGMIGSNSLANLQGLYTNPASDPAIVAHQQQRSDGYGGLSDLMFAGGSGGQQQQQQQQHRFSHQQSPVQPAQSPIDFNGLPQYQTRRY